MSTTVNWNPDAVLGSVGKRSLEALKRVGSDLREKSEKLCPKKRGYNGGLVSTAYTEIDETEGTLRVGYKAPHSHLQHENLRNKHKNGESAKFLERPLLENKERYLQIIADTVSKSFK